MPPSEMPFSANHGLVSATTGKNFSSRAAIIFLFSPRLLPGQPVQLLRMMGLRPLLWFFPCFYPECNEPITHALYSSRIVRHRT